MIEILSPAKVARARVTGALVAEILQTMKSRAVVGTNLLEIDGWVREMIEAAGAESCYVDYAPSFGNGPFGHYICTGVNDAVLHGLPHDYALADGDLLSLDLAVLKDGVAADAAISFIVGESRPAESVAMIEATERALAAGPLNKPSIFHFFNCGANRYSAHAKLLDQLRLGRKLISRAVRAVGD